MFGKLIIVMISMVLLASNAEAGGWCGNWTKKNVQLEAVSLSLIIADTLQTASWVEDPNSRWHEWNPLLGKHPTENELYNSVAIGMITHVMIANYLSPEWRTKFQYATIAIQAGIVMRSHGMGIRIGASY